MNAIVIYKSKYGSILLTEKCRNVKIHNIIFEDSPWWTEEDTIMFNKKKKFAYDQLCKELGEEFEILYCCGEWS